MSRIWRIVSLSGGALVIGAGALLLMGNLRHASLQRAPLEQARLEALAEHWAGQIQAVHTTLYEQIVRQGVLNMLDHPEDWSDWRAQAQLGEMAAAWPAERGSIRTLVLIGRDGSAKATLGEARLLPEALMALSHGQGSPLAVFSPAQERSQLVVIKHSPPRLEPAPTPASLLVIVDVTPLLQSGLDLPEEWVLMGGPRHVVAGSTPQQERPGIAELDWPLMLTQRSGYLSPPDGGAYCFAPVVLPGVRPMMLVRPVHARSSAAAVFGFTFIILGAGLLLTSSVRTLLRDPEPVPSVTPVVELETAALRQILQSIEDPLWVIDGGGRVIRTNRKAESWLRLENGRPPESTLVRICDGEMPLADFLEKAAADPGTASGACRLVVDGRVVSGTLVATRLPQSESTRGPVLLHFHVEPQIPGDRRPGQRPLAAAVPAGIETHCPFPVLAVTPAGLITGFNDAARQVCAKLDETPLLTEILPGVDGHTLPALLASRSGTTFESLFGSGAHEFKLVRTDSRILLYAHRLSASKKLEVELKQAQENFYGLCSLVPQPVLLVDPRDHLILEANAAAAALFGSTQAALRGGQLDAFSRNPLDLTAADAIFHAAAPDGSDMPCALSFELIKIEGMPALLIVLEPQLASHTSLESHPLRT